jgi:hypothetical protein
VTRRPPPLAVALLDRCGPDHAPLAGDLLEEWPARTNAWLWRQVLSVICHVSLAALRADPRGAMTTALVASGMLALLGFCAMVAASLLQQVLVRSDVHWWFAAAGDGAWPVLFRVVSCSLAVLIGRTVIRFHSRHRVGVILACGASVTVAASANLAFFVPTLPDQPFFAHPGMQMAETTLFVAGLFAGILSRSACEPLSSSS